LLIPDGAPQKLVPEDDEPQPMASAKEAKKASNCARFVGYILGSFY
jgi:hypothetical protein